VTLRIVTLTAAQLFDLLTFVRLVDARGPNAEGNPLVRYAVEAHGLPTVVLLKLALVLLLVSAFVTLYRGGSSGRRFPRYAGVIVAASVISGLLGGLSNVATL
jgi:hypothetical protein